MNRPRLLLRAAMIADGSGLRAAPGALLLEGSRLLAAGSPGSIGLVANATVVDLPDSLLVPALVNAHAHLDLSHIGPVGYTGDFVSWVELVRSRRANAEAGISAAVAHGAALSRAGGTGLVGDIAGVRSISAVTALRAAGLPGVSYVEFFGLGRTQPNTIATLRTIAETCPPEAEGVRLGLQPHSPYSCGLDVFEAAAAMGLPLATHLAETPEELQFVSTGGGPLAEMIRRIGVWDDTIRGSGRHPIEHLADVLAAVPFVAAHVNYLDDHHLEQLARWPISIAYCPRASAYFGHPRPRIGQTSHRYREMIEAGINVALGTDSLLCLDTPDRISVLDEMRLLFDRDGADPMTLLRLATINGAAALGFDPGIVSFKPGVGRLGVLALRIDPRSGVDPLIQAMRADDPPRWAARPFDPDDRTVRSS